MRTLYKKMESLLNDFSVKKKLIITYMFCVIIPLIVTDSIIFAILYMNEQTEQNYEMESAADSLRYDLQYTFDEAVNILNDIYINYSVYEFLDKEYESQYEFIMASQVMTSGNTLQILGGYNMTNLIAYGDNDTIVNGGRFHQLAEAKDTIWYKEFAQSGKNMMLSIYYVDDAHSNTKKYVTLARKLDCFGNDEREKIVRIDLDYNALARKWASIQYGYNFMICDGEHILFDNVGGNRNTEDFQLLTGDEPVAYKSELNLCGKDVDILILKPKSSVVDMLIKYMPFILFLVLINFVFPCIMVILVNNSFTRRLRELGQAFDEVQGENLKGIEDVQGKDEIGVLMHNYNSMVERINDLIMRVYKGRLEKQEVDLARQNAELLALHSQINPHFLFNVLESIRMHCILQGENETAGMIEKLAVLERQNVNWAQDNVKLKDEINFVEAYLELQRYRFGNRLHYEIDLPKELENYHIPKLTLTTFVENSCVHGMEEKSASCWIYVRVSKKDNWLYLEIEDTGGGMEDDAVLEMNERMAKSCIDDIKANKHIGIINACLRLKMISDGNVEFLLESEKGVGTFITIKVNTDYLEDERLG